jgi:N-acetylmuramoyl-L-alanine amidase
LENKILGTQTGEPIRSIQAGMMSSLVQRRSKVFAESLDLEFSRNFGNLIPSRGVKKADFAVLRGSLMPAVLIEMGFLSHPQESIYLNSEKVQKKIAESIVRGIQSYGERKDG